ncbi:MAG: hypothetical protein L3K14_04105 [Thermoplasmata archaeon]|nr:hypothetical protein [Thermoplasmata archaeon]
MKGTGFNGMPVDGAAKRRRDPPATIGILDPAIGFGTSVLFVVLRFLVTVGASG